MRNCDLLSVGVVSLAVYLPLNAMTVLFQFLREDRAIEESPIPPYPTWLKMAIVAVLAGVFVRWQVGYEADAHRQAGRCMMWAPAAALLVGVTFCLGGWRWVMDGV